MPRIYFRRNLRSELSNEVQCCWVKWNFVMLKISLIAKMWNELRCCCTNHLIPSKDFFPKKNRIYSDGPVIS